MEFRLLGPLEVWDGPRRATIAGRLHPRILAGLLLNNGRVVPLSWLVDLLWGAEPPATARRQAQNAVAALRRQLGADSAELVERVGQGYRVNVADEAVDLHRFETLTNQARRGAEAGDHREACRVYERALGLWRGSALEGMTGRALVAAAARLDDLRLSASEDFAASALAVGEPERVLARLETLADRHPLRQRLTARLMHALHQSGRTPEALRRFDAIRIRLADELGLDPGPDLTTLRSRILQDDPSLFPQSTDGPAPATTTTTMPAQLPADISTFTGRRDQLAVLDRLRRSGGKAGIVSTIAGIGGVGKTALVVHWGHGNREHFPDGQLYLNLRGFDEREPLTAHEALTRLLRALGHPIDRIPSDVEQAAALYRTALAEKRALVILDNARTPEQVRPLLPDSPGSLAVVTSRNRLSALVASDDAHPVELETLSPGESRELLVRLLGAEAVTDVEATGHLAKLCGHLPLALRVAAANHSRSPDQPLAAYVRALDEGSRLAGLRIDDDRDTDLTAVFDLSYRTLAPDTRRVFVHIALIPGDDFTTDLAVAVADVPMSTVKAAFDELTTAHLLEQHQPDRYRFHDLVRHYARQTASHILDDTRRASVRDRMLDWYGDRSNPYLPELDNILAACEAFSSYRQLWKLANILGLISQAGGDPRRSRHFVKLALQTAEQHHHVTGQIYALDALGVIAWVLGENENALACRKAAFDLLPGITDYELHGKINNNLSISYCVTGRHRDAEVHLRRAIEVAETGKLPELAIVSLSNLGAVHRALGRFDHALESLSQADTIADRMEIPFRRVLALLGLGLVYKDMGRCEEASTAASHALEITQKLTASRLTAQAIQLLGRISHRAGELEDAAKYYEQAIYLSSQDQNIVLQVTSLQYQAELFLDTGEIQTATTILNKAHRIMSGQPNLNPENSYQERLLCRAHTASGEWEAAIRPGQQAVEFYRTTHPNPYELAISLDTLGDAHHGHGDTLRAHDCWNEALDLFTGLDVPDAAGLRAKIRRHTSVRPD